VIAASTCGCQGEFGGSFGGGRIEEVLFDCNAQQNSAARRVVVGDPQRSRQQVASIWAGFAGKCRPSGCCDLNDLQCQCVVLSGDGDTDRFSQSCQVAWIAGEVLSVRKLAKEKPRSASSVRYWSASSNQPIAAFGSKRRVASWPAIRA
jgi:hypothetical protein